MNSAFPGVIAFAVCVAVACGAPSGDVHGTVISNGNPVAGASVRYQATAPEVLTDANGAFHLPPTAAGSYVTAGKAGYYNARTKVSSRPLTIELLPIPREDSARYQWQDPTPNRSQKDNCGNCHDRIYNEWLHDPHSRSADNPLVISLYNGTNLKGDVKAGPGYRIDWNDNGDCGTCHAPMAAIGRSTEVEMNSVHGVERAGVACDFCHKVSAIATLADSPDFGDVKVLRPAQGGKLLFGPFDDATFQKEIPDFSYSPLFRSSRLCAPCHDGRSWGVPTYETYSEWLKSSYNSRNIQCQDCHMKSTGTERLIANEQDGGKLRDPARIATHSMMGELEEKFLRSALEMRVHSSVEDGIVSVNVELKNTGAGHSVPSGQPMRNIILLVSVVDSSGKPLPFVEGERVPVWGGVSGGSKDYAGQPGKGFAKVLSTLNEYQRFSFVSDLKKVTGDFPAPMWRRNRIVSDNRIPAEGRDESSYFFEASAASGDTAVVSCRLIYRRAFKTLADSKDWNLPDVAVAEVREPISLRRTASGAVRQHKEGSSAAIQP